MILGHNVEYMASMSRLPILVLECSKGGHQERGVCQSRSKFDFCKGLLIILLTLLLMKLPEIFMLESCPPGRPFAEQFNPPPDPPVPFGSTQINRV